MPDHKRGKEKREWHIKRKQAERNKNREKDKEKAAIKIRKTDCLLCPAETDGGMKRGGETEGQNTSCVFLLSFCWVVFGAFTFDPVKHFLTRGLRGSAATQNRDRNANTRASRSMYCTHSGHVCMLILHCEPDYKQTSHAKTRTTKRVKKCYFLTTHHYIYTAVFSWFSHSNDK